MQNQLKIATFNVLAPCWASPVNYFPTSETFLNRQFRRALIIQALQKLVISHDFIALQETQEDEIHFFENELKACGFAGFHVNHKDSYWQKYVTPDVPFAPNGVGLYWNTKKVLNLSKELLSLSEDGNSCAFATFKMGSTTIRVVSCHLDADQSGKRLKQANAIMAALPRKNNTIDIVAGDFNFNTDMGPLQQIISKSNFVNILEAVGKQEATHPFTSKYAQNANYGNIDHILVRGAIPKDGTVLTFNVWQDATSEEERVNLLLQRNGSDHFIVTGQIEF